MKKRNLLWNLMIFFCFYAIAFAQTETTSNAEKQETKEVPFQFNSLATLFAYINDITWQIHSNTAKNNFEEKSKLTEQKNTLLQYFISNIRDTKQPLGFTIEENRQAQRQMRLNINDSEVQHDTFMLLRNTIQLNDLLIESELATLFMQLRKQIDFFSQKQKIINIIEPHLKALQALPTNFENLDTLTKQKQQELMPHIEQYRNKLATAIEIATYLEWHAAEFVPQDTMLHTSMRWTLQILANFISVSHDNINVIKAILSLLCFLILWACRTLITKIFIACMDIMIHLANQDKELHALIQKDLLRPISLFLFVWSLRVCVGVLYYPHLQPEDIDVWFSILYVVNIAWFLVAMIKSYGTVFLTKVLQKSNSEFRKEIISLILKVLDSIIIIIAILIILKLLGFNVSAIIASLGLGGLAVALAIKDMLANFFASVMLLVDNSFSQGDWIECGSVDGTVVEIGLRHTTIRTADNALLFVPNSELAGKVIRNWSRRKSGRRLKMTIGVTYDANETRLKKCVLALQQMLRDHPQITTEIEYAQDDPHLATLRKDIISMDDLLGYKTGIFVCVESLGDSSINILVECFVESVTKKAFYEVREDIIYRIMKIVEESNLSFAFPSQSLYIESMPK